MALKLQKELEDNLKDTLNSLVGLFDRKCEKLEDKKIEEIDMMAQLYNRLKNAG